VTALGTGTGVASDWYYNDAGANQSRGNFDSGKANRAAAGRNAAPARVSEEAVENTPFFSGSGGVGLPPGIARRRRRASRSDC
jgi:hypothetical protein